MRYFKDPSGDVWASLPVAGHGQREVKMQELVNKWKEFGGE